jgi:type IV pilus assembly protein PilV
MTILKRPIDQKGFSMIEVLVTLVLISIGVLGMVAMQARTITYTQDSVQRNAAAALADDLLEILRADSGHVLDARGIPSSDSDYYKAKGSDFPSPADEKTCGSSIATATDRLGCWAIRAQAALPGADELMRDEFHVCRTSGASTCSGTGSAIEVQVAWRVREGECLDNSDAASSDLTICRYRIRTEI